jgi:transcriptional regulator with XRE-family HTH domain
MTLGANVKEYRHKRGLDQKELALILGVASPTISNIERDIKTPSLKTLKRLAYVLRCTVADLMKE